MSDGGMLVRKVTEDPFRLKRERLCRRGWIRTSKADMIRCNTLEKIWSWNSFFYYYSFSFPDEFKNNNLIIFPP